jgi:hypothetical protein
MISSLAGVPWCGKGKRREIVAPTVVFPLPLVKKIPVAKLLRHRIGLKEARFGGRFSFQGKEKRQF